MIESKFIEIKKQLKQALNPQGDSSAIGDVPQKIIFCGMGGSGMAGELMADIFPGMGIVNHHSYSLPPDLDPGSCIVIVSYSGQTKEALSCFQEAFNRGLKTIVITGGGELAKRAQGKNVALIIVPHNPNVAARHAAGYLVKASLMALQLLGKIGSADQYIRIAIEHLDESPEEKIDQIVKEIGNSQTIVLYSPPQYNGLARFWKMAFNETLKLPAFVGSIPEATHNEIESLNKVKQKHILFIRDRNLDKELWNHIKAFQELAQNHNWPTSNIDLNHSERIANVLYGVNLALGVSNQIAADRKIDPNSTPFIDELKSLLPE